MNFKTSGFCLAAILVASSASAAPENADSTSSPSELLIAATKAIQSASYRGTIINLQADDRNVLRIFHRRENGVEQQRLVAMTGPVREIIRKGSKVISILPSKEVVLISHQRRKGALGRLTQVTVKEIKQSYTLKMGGVQRIASRFCRVLRIIPRDKYRYGYRLALDKKTHLPLKLELVNDQRVLERLMFARIRFEKTMPDRLFTSQYKLKGYRVIKHRAIEKSGEKTSAPKWTATRLPPGFERVASGVRKVSKNAVVRQILYSDGLASVSAFIAPAGLRAPLKGSTSRGSVHAYGRQVDDRQVTVVGQVPTVTVKLIAKHLQRK